MLSLDFFIWYEVVGLCGFVFPIAIGLIGCGEVSYLRWLVEVN